MPDSLSFAAPVQLRAAADKSVAVSILAYTGGVMYVPGQNWGYTLVDIDGLDIAASVPLLFDHDATLHGVVGSASARPHQGMLTAGGTLSRAAGSTAKVIAMSQSGVRWQASIGVRASERIRIPEGQTVLANGRQHTAPEGGMWLIRKGRLNEITICALGADPDTQVDIAAQGSPGMPDPTPSTPNTETTLNASGQSADDIRRAERERIGRIEKTCSGDWGANLERVQELKAQAISGELSEAELASSLLAMVRSSGANRLEGFVPAGASLKASRGGAISQEIVECALLLKAGNETAARSYGEPVLQRAADVHRKSLFELQNALLQASGRETFSSMDEMLRASAGGYSTISLPTTLGNTANRTLEVIVRETPATWRSFAAVRTTSNFLDNTGIRPSFVGDLEQVGKGGELKSGTMEETLFTWRADTYGKFFSVDRKTFINDGVDFFSQVVPTMGRQAMRKLNDLVWSTILANANSHFHANNNNYIAAGGGGDLSTAALATAIKQMREQTDGNGNNLDIPPAVLVVPPDLEMTAKGILHSAETRRAVAGGTDVNLIDPTGNPLSNIVKLEVEPRIANAKFTNNSATRWYLFAAPMHVPVIVGFLNGRQSPTVEFFGLDHDVQTLGYSWRCYQDFGCALADPKAGQMSDGLA